MYVSGDAGRVRRLDGSRLVAVALAALMCALALCVRPAFASAADGADRAQPNSVVRGGLEVHKALPLGTGQGDTSVEGVTFDVYLERGGAVLVNDVWFRSIEQDGDQAVPCARIVTDERGVAATDDDYLPYGTYRVVEVGVPEGQDMATMADGSPWHKTVEVHSSRERVYVGEVTNTPVRTTVSVMKRDVQQDGAQGDASLAGAVFTVYNRSESAIQYRKSNGEVVTVESGGIVDTMRTDASGYAQLPEDSLDYGTYEAVETTPPAGYTLGDVAWSSGHVACHVKGEVKSLGVCSNDVERGGLVIIKQDREHDAAIPQGDAKLNAEYTVWTRGEHDVIVGGVTYHKDQVVYKGRANEVTGVLTIPANTFPYGTYEVRETAAPYGYLIDEEWSYTFSVRADGSTYQPTQSEANKNEPVRGGIRVVKVDADTGQSAPQGNGDLSGITIDIYNASAMPIFYEGTEVKPGEKVTSMKTRLVDGSYVAQTESDALPMGTYTLRESDVPESTGYLRNLGWSPTVVIREQGQMAVALVEP